MIFGPHEQSVGSTASLNTSAETIYQLISGKSKELHEDGLPLFVDIRDVARAHVLALQNNSVIGKQILLSGEPYTLYEVSLRMELLIPEVPLNERCDLQTVQLLAKKRPELRSRLPSLDNAKPETRVIAKIDTSIAREELGLSFMSFEKSLLDTVDALLEKEKTEWSA